MASIGNLTVLSASHLAASFRDLALRNYREGILVHRHGRPLFMLLGPRSEEGETVHYKTLFTDPLVRAEAMKFPKLVLFHNRIVAEAIPLTPEQRASIPRVRSFDCITL